MINEEQVREYAKQFLPGISEDSLWELLARLRDPDVVFAVCPTTERQVVVYGLEALERCIATNTPLTASVVSVRVNHWDGDGPEWLAALVMCLRPN